MVDDAARRQPTARYREIDAKTITRLRGMVDPWFLGRYGMNLYRGCEHACEYCDGRAERYYVTGDFGRDIAVKRNAVAVLAAQLGKLREPGFMLLGGGVCDAYQPAEAQYQLARGVLELALQHNLPVHVLTKSCLVQRDLDLLTEINQQTLAILSFSIQTLDDSIRERFEPRAAPINERLRLMQQAHERGLAVGAMAMPVLPGISDQPAQVDRLVEAVAAAGADFVCFGGLTLRPGVQMDTYLRTVEMYRPDLLAGYQRAYRNNRRSGAPDARYLARVDARFISALVRHGIPGRPPRRLFSGLIPCYAEIGVLLEHREFGRRMEGKPGGGLARSGGAIQQWAQARIGRLARRKTFHFTQVEHELMQMIRDGSLLSLPGVTSAALAHARQLVDTARTRPNGRRP